MSNRFFPNSTVSRYAQPDNRSYLSVVYQSGKPVLDADINLTGDLVDHLRARVGRVDHPSGWVRRPGRASPANDFTFYLPGDPAFAANTLGFAKQMAVVAGLPVVVEYTDTTTAGLNQILLDDPPVLGGAPPDIRRSDFVFLEVWIAKVQMSPPAKWTVEVLVIPTAADTLTFNWGAGPTPLTATAGAPPADQFNVGASLAATASNIAAAINLNTNSFFNKFTAVADGAVVTITADDAGAAGNAYTIVASAPASLDVNQVQLGVDTDNKATQELVWRHGNVLSPSHLGLDEQMVDSTLNLETTQRLQVQYRIRATGQTEAVNHITENDGFSNANVLAQGTQVAPVPGYTFIRADRTTNLGYEDPGLWFAGDGTEAAATALGTVDGFVYAIPICMVFRRNDASGGNPPTGGWDPVNNTPGALPYTHDAFVSPYTARSVGADKSDRPDGLFCDVIAEVDLLDLRMHIANHDLSPEVEYQTQSLLDGTAKTWAVNSTLLGELGTGSGDVSVQPLVCDELGRAQVSGGNSPESGNTGRGQVVRNFDHVARRFSSRPVIERFVIWYEPTVAEPGFSVMQANVGYVGWAEDDELTLDFTTLHASTMGDMNSAATYGIARVADFFPPGTIISDVLGIYHDDGNYVSAVNQQVQIKTIGGIGTASVTLTLDANQTQMTGGLDPPAGTAQAGGAATITLAAGASAVNDFYKGWTVTLTNDSPAGTIGLAGLITAYNGATKVATISVPWATAPDNTTTYRLTYPTVGTSTADSGSQRRIFLEVEVAYPAGSGLSCTPDVVVTPDATVWGHGPVVETAATQRPGDYETPLRPRITRGIREVQLEYVANSPGSGASSGVPITDTFVSLDNQTVTCLRRLFGSATAVLAMEARDEETVAVKAINLATTEFGSSSRALRLSAPLSGAQTLCRVKYFAQDPIPNYGALGYQVGVYYRTLAPQTVGTRDGVLNPPMPNKVKLQPIAASGMIWTGQTGKGSDGTPYPYDSPLDQIPVRDDPTAPTFEGEWQLAATAMVELGDFSADTGLLSLAPHVNVDITDEIHFGDNANPPRKDTENRAFYEVATTDYNPVAMARSLASAAIHKTFTTMLCRAVEDSTVFRAGEILLVVLTNWSELTAKNEIRFTASNTANRACAAVYRTRGRLLLPVTE